MLEWLLKPDYLEAFVGFVAVAAAIVVALYVSPWVNAIQSAKDSKERILRSLLVNRLNPSDPAWQAALSLIPLDFEKSHKVMAAFNAYLKHVSVDPATIHPESLPAHLDHSNNLQRKLIESIASDLGVSGLSSDALKNLAYISSGFSARSKLNDEGMKSWPQIATALAKHNEQIDFLLSRQFPGEWPPQKG